MSADGAAARRPDGRALKMSELAQRSGVSAGTIRHYLREGLLGDGSQITRTSRNMAYYPPELVQRIALIKRLQEERFMPLRLIRELLAEHPDRLEALIELEDRIVERAVAGSEVGRVPVQEAQRRYGVPANVLERLREIGVLSPGEGEDGSSGYGQEDLQIIEALSRFRAGGYAEDLGFTVYDTLRYRRALEPLVAEEVRVLLERLAGEVEVERALQMIAAGVDPLRDLIGAMHTKLLVEEIRSQRQGERYPSQ